MIRVAGSGRSGNMPSSAPSFSTSSSSSTLSPLAPPFTVDRSLSAVTNPSSMPLPPTTCSASSKYAYPRPNPTTATVPYFAPTGDSVCPPSSSATSASSRLGNINSVFGAVEAAPYYPYYASMRDSVDGSFGKLPDYKGHTGGWNGQFDVEIGIPRRASISNSSWLDPSSSSQMSLPSHRRGSVESFSTHEESFGSWHGAHNEFSSVLGHVGSEGSEWLDDRHLGIYVDSNRMLTDGPHATELDTTMWPNEGSSYFYSPETTVVKECDTFIPNSYDRYISQLISSSRDLTVHYPAPASSSSQGCPSNERNGSFSCTVSKNGSPVVKHINLQKKEDDHSVSKQHEISMYKNAEGKEGLVRMGISSDALWKDSGTSSTSLLVNGLSLGSISSHKQSIDCSHDVMSGFKAGSLGFCKASNSGVGSFMPDDCIETSSETHDHLNIAVDSPCWKGSSASRGCPFGPDEIIEPLAISENKSSDDVVQGLRSSRVQSDIKQSNTIVCSESVKDIPSAIHKDLSPVTALSDFDLKLQGCIGKGRGSNLAKENTKETAQHNICEEYNTMIEQENVPEGIGKYVRQLCQAEYTICEGTFNTGEPVLAVQNSVLAANHISTSQNYTSQSKAYTSNGEILSSPDAIFSNELTKPFPSNASNRCFTHGQDTRALVMAMLSLSEVLLCHNCNGDDSFEEDLKPVQKVIDNLEAFILRNKKNITGECSCVPRVETHLELKESDAEVSCNKDLKDTKENGNLMRSGLYNDKHDNIILKSFNTNFEESDGIAPSFTKVPKHDFLEHEEDPKLLLYKNLWIQTESALHSLKHDVALMKLEMGNFKHQFKGAMNSKTLPEGSAVEPDSHGCDELQVLNCATALHILNPSSIEAERNLKRSTQKEDKDSSVIARYRILKGRHDADYVDADFSQGSDATKTTVAGPDDIPSEKFLGLDYRIGTGLFLNDSEPAVSALDRSSIQSYNPRNHVKWLLSSGSDSHSSEWEHVLKDEFLW